MFRKQFEPLVKQIENKQATVIASLDYGLAYMDKVVEVFTAQLNSKNDYITKKCTNTDGSTKSSCPPDALTLKMQAARTILESDKAFSKQIKDDKEGFLDLTKFKTDMVNVRATFTKFNSIDQEI
jgi:hypothetical protein